MVGGSLSMAVVVVSVWQAVVVVSVWQWSQYGSSVWQVVVSVWQ